MPYVLTIEGLEDGPGQQRSRAKGLRQTVRVKRSTTGKTRGHCVSAEYATPHPSIPRMADLCIREGITTMLVGGKTINLTRGKSPEASAMAGYNDVMDFPPIEDLGLIDAGFIKDGLLATGTNVAARTLADATNAIGGPWWVKPIIKAAAGLGGGAALTMVHRDSGMIAMSTLLGDAIYRDGLKRFILDEYFSEVFNGVEVEETRLLGGLTENERALLDGNVEEDELSPFGEEVDVDEGNADRIEVDGLDDFEDSAMGSWLQ